MIVRESLFESKQVGILYHIVDYQSLLFNLTNDKIGGGSNHKLSFTRNKNYLEIPSHVPKERILGRFVVDGNKLSTRYKIRPFKAYDPTLDVKEDEYEEQVIGTIKSLHLYLIKLEIFYGVLWNIRPEEKFNTIKTAIKEYSEKFDINIEYIK